MRGTLSAASQLVNEPRRRLSRRGYDRLQCARRVRTRARSRLPRASIACTRTVYVPRGQLGRRLQAPTLRALRDQRERRRARTSPRSACRSRAGSWQPPAVRRAHADLDAARACRRAPPCRRARRSPRRRGCRRRPAARPRAAATRATGAGRRGVGADRAPTARSSRRRRRSRRRAWRPASGVGAAAATVGLGAAAVTGGSWKATSASWIDPPAWRRRSAARSRRGRARSTPANSLSGIRRPLSTTWRRNEPTRRLERGPERHRRAPTPTGPRGRSARRRSPAIALAGFGAVGDRVARVGEVHRGRAGSACRSARRCGPPPTSCARSVAGPSQASVSWRPKERLVEAVEVPTPFGGQALICAPRSLVAILVAPVVGREAGAAQLAARGVERQRDRRLRPDHVLARRGRRDVAGLEQVGAGDAAQRGQALGAGSRPRRSSAARTARSMPR